MAIHKKVSVTAVFIIMSLAWVFWGGMAWADILTSGSNSSTGATNYIASFDDVTSVELTGLTAEVKVLVVATFSCASAGTATTTARTAHFCLTDGTPSHLTPDPPNGLLRYLSGASDNGIGSIVHIFTAGAGTNIFTLQHYTPTASDPTIGITTGGTIAAVVLTGLISAEANVIVEDEASSESYTEVTKVGPIDLPSTGDLYVAASLNSTGAKNQALGTWKLGYNTDGGITWTEFGQSVSRSFTTRLSDVGAVSLCALHQEQNMGPYYFSLLAKTDNSNNAILTNNVNLVAVALSTSGVRYYSFSASATGAETDSPATVDDAVIQAFNLQNFDSNVFLHAQYTGMGNTGSSTGKYNLTVSSSILDGQDQDRYFKTPGDSGSGSSVGLALAVDKTTPYTAALHHEVSSGTLTTDSYLLGIALTSGDPLLVDLVSFAARDASDRVILEWETASEIDTAGFHLWRSDMADGTYSRITDTLIPAEGGATFGSAYAYVDTDVTEGQAYFYKLETIDNSGENEFFGPVSTASVLGDDREEATPVPTLSQWGAMVLFLILGAGAVLGLRLRRRRLN